MGDNFKATAKALKDIPFDKLIQAIHVTQERLGVTEFAKGASETESPDLLEAVSFSPKQQPALVRKTADIKA